MPKCPNGHEQKLGLKCQICGAEISYREAIDELRTLPKVSPSYGKVAVLAVGFPRLKLRADYVGEIKTGSTDQVSSTLFEVESVRGESWLELYRKSLDALKRWLKLVAIEKSDLRFMVVDTTQPVSVLAIAAMPKLDDTALFAVIADEDSTPVQQNISYVALSVALKKGIPVVAISESYERDMLFFAEERGFATSTDAISRLLEPVLAAPDLVTDLLEGDLRLGIRMHCISAILSGSKSVYGVATNAYMAQTYDLSMPAEPSDCKTVHSVVFSRIDSEAEFEKSFGVFRSRRFKGALSAEFRFRETASDLYDLMTIYGMKTESSLKGISAGYDAIVKSVPELTAEGVV